MYLDEHLTWSDHVETIIEKISKTCGILNKLKYRPPQSIFLNIYNTLILPYLQYCAIVWANCNHFKLNPFFVIQKRAVRNICKLKYLTHTAPYFKNFHVLTNFLIFIHYKFLSSCLRLLLIYCHLALQHIFKLILLFIPITQGIYRIIIFHLLELPSV